MSKHKPIKFQTTLEPKLIQTVKDIIDSNKNAKKVLNATLAIAAVGGVLTVGAIAPNAVGMILRMQKRQRERNREKYYQAWRSFNALKKQRALELVREDDDGLVYRLSDKGKNKVKKFIFDELSIKNPETWDGRWRLITFDIPERKRAGRVALTRKLKELGFYQCQKSVWVYPFPCDEEIEFLKDVFSIQPFVKIFIVDEMTDGKVIHYFGDLIKNL